MSFKPLYQGPVVYFVDSAGKRTSPNFFRKDAVDEFMAKCGNAEPSDPVTQRSIAKVRDVPNVMENPKMWFRACDVDGDNKLSRDEVISALKAQLPLDSRSIDVFKTDDAAWGKWDADRSGFIEFEEIMDAEKGLLKFIAEAFSRSADELPIPDLRVDRMGWYSRWDEDNSGELEFDEVLRAMTKTFNIDVAGVNQLREALQAVWVIFDGDGSGSVDKAEFLEPRDGLADTILATLGAPSR